MALGKFPRRSVLLAGAAILGSCAHGPSPHSEVLKQMTITADDVVHLIADLEKGANAWVNGQLEETASTTFTQANEMVLVGPFGGAPLKGEGEWGARQSAAVKAFTEGNTKLELVDWQAGGDLLVLVLIERGQTRFAGQSSLQPWVLRTTQVFRRSDQNKWVRLLRHADPLADFRPTPATAALARGE